MRVTSKSSKTAKGDPMCKWVLLFTSNSFTFSLNITVSQGQGQENPKDLQICGSPKISHTHDNFNWKVDFSVSSSPLFFSSSLLPR